MGYLRQTEDLIGNVLYTFSTKLGSGNLDFERRTAPFEIAGVDWSASPFGDGPAPIKGKEWEWKCRVMTAGNGDGARDTLTSAVGAGERIHLVWRNDDGTERVAPAYLKHISWPVDNNSRIVVDVGVTFVIDDFWQERQSANVQVIGVGTPIIAGAVAPGTNTLVNPTNIATLTSNTVSLATSIADASVAGTGGIPNAPDTGPRITIYGPFGGDPILDANGKPIGGGFVVRNDTITLKDAMGVTYAPYINVFRKVAAGEVVGIDCAAKIIGSTAAGNLTGLKFVPKTQPYWMAVKPKAANSLVVYAIGANATNYYQPVSLTGNPTSGNFTLTVPATSLGGPSTTGNIAQNASAATVLAALAATVAVGGVGNVVVQNFLSGGVGYNSNGNRGYDVYFVGALAGQTVGTMTSANTFNQGAVSIASVRGRIEFRWIRKFY